MRDRADTGTPQRTVVVDVPVSVLSALRRHVPPGGVDAFVRAAVAESLAADPRAS